MNKNMGRFWIEDCMNQFYGDENIELISGANDHFAYSIAESATRCQVYIFEPTLAGERWEILMVSYEDERPSTLLHSRVAALARQLGVKVNEVECG